jgi:indolepyruvate ferredoxin oxidoreductase beta subunit
MNTSIMIVGVGGQGTLLASRILGNVAIKCGYDVKVSEVHGMSQRGGSVVTYVRYGNENVYSPVIAEGSADIIMAFEELEAMRSLEFLKKGGRLLVNSQNIDPMPVIIGKAKYPEGIIDKIKALSVDLTAIDALSLATEAGSSKAVNIVLLGRLSKYFDFTDEEWMTAIEESVPAKFLELNKKAFGLGRNA